MLKHDAMNILKAALNKAIKKYVVLKKKIDKL